MRNPPTQTRSRVDLPRRFIVASTVLMLPIASGANGLMDSLFGKRVADDFLPPEKAFRVRLGVSGPTTLIATFEPAPGYYLYRERIGLRLQGSPGVVIRRVQVPAGERKNDPNFGWTDVFRSPVQVMVELDRAPPAGRLAVVVSYQGCEERRGVCYPPAETEVTIAMSAAR